MSEHNFVAIGTQLAASLIKAADDQVAEVHKLRDSVMELAEAIGVQLEEHAKMLSEMDDRMRTFGSSVLDAHKKFINGGKHENPSP